MTRLCDQPPPDNGRDRRVATRVEQLYVTYASLVRAVCRSLLRDRIEAEDAAQQTFLSAQRALLNGSSPRDDAAWLAAIARNESLARVRARTREPLMVEIDDAVTAPDVHTVALQRHLAQELGDALAGLPYRQREAIFLREVHGLTSQQVAIALAVTTGTAESLVFRARRSLRVRLQGALAGVTPGLWWQPLRELAARVAGGGLAGPAAAKIAAVGAGTLIATGGALVGPRVLGLEHGVRPLHRDARSAAAKPAHAPLLKAHATLSPSVAQPVRPQPVRRQLVATRPAGERQTIGDESAKKTAAVPTSSSEPSSDEASSTSTHGSPPATSDGSTDGTTAQPASSGSGDASQPGTSTTDSGSSSADTSAPATTGGDSGGTD